MTEENIHVVIRFRPTNKREKKEEREKKIQDKPPIFQNDDERGIGVVEICGEKSKTPHNFTFNRILDSTVSQESVFNHVAKHVCDDILIGYNGCIFAYGQTGSGKTYTMFGPEDDHDHPQKMGIIPRSVSYIFSEIEEHPDIIDARIKVSFVEIYKEKLRDLLNPKSSKKSKKAKKPLTIRLQQNGETRIVNIKEKKVLTILDVLSLIEVANSYRTKAATSMNHSSSRSHMLMTLTVTLRMEDGSLHVGKLNFCDLAGSEKVRKTNATGERLKEAQNINLSLTILGQVISALSQEKKHVPFRDSKLTYVLKDSLGGNCKTTLIVNCTEHMFNRDETVGSLRFGSRCKLISNQVKVNRTYSNKELLNMIEKLRRENAMLRGKGVEEVEDVFTSPKGNKLFKKKTKTKKKEKVKDDWGSTGGTIGVGGNKTWIEEKKKLKKKLNKMEGKYHYMQVQNHQLEEKIIALYDELDSKERQSTMLNSRLVDYQAQYQGIDKIENENMELKLKMKSMEALNSEYRMEIGDMKKERHYKATKLNHQLEQFKELHQDAQQETTELMDEVLKLKQSTEKSEVIIDALDHKLIEKRKDMDALQKELLERERRVSKIFKEKMSLEKQLKELKTTIAKNDSDLTLKNDTIEQLKDELDQRTQELTAQIHELSEKVEQREIIQHTYSIRSTDPVGIMQDISETEDVKTPDYSDLLTKSATIHTQDDVIHAEQSLLAQYDYLQNMETVRRESTLEEKQRKLINTSNNPNEEKILYQQQIDEKKKTLVELRKMKTPKDKDERLKLFLKIGSLEDDIVQLKRKLKKLNKKTSKVRKHIKDDSRDVTKVTTEDVMHYIDAALTLSALKDDDENDAVSAFTYYDEDLDLVT